MNQTLVNDAVSQLANLLIQHHLTITTAESCTGGMVAASLTDLAGSSNWFERGFVTYSNVAKEQNLGVPMDLIQQHGAVSLAVAKAMAIGAMTVSGSDVGLGITGVAGPTGGSPEKPVGFVCFGWAIKKDGAIQADSEGVFLLKPEDLIEETTRSRVRILARDYALDGLMRRLKKSFEQT